MPAKKVSKKKAGQYTASVKFLGRVYKSSGESVLEAITGLNLNIKKISSIVIMTVEHDGAVKDRILRPLITNRLFSPSKLTREIALKNTSILFEGI